MCRTLDVSSSGYYRSLNAGPSQKAQRSARIRTSVKQVHEESQGVYGSYKIADRVKDDDSLEAACRNTVACIVSQTGDAGNGSEEQSFKEVLANDNGF